MQWKAHGAKERGKSKLQGNQVNNNFKVLIRRGGRGGDGLCYRGSYWGSYRGIMETRSHPASLQCTIYGVQFLSQDLEREGGGGRPHKMQEKHGQPRVVEKGKEGRGRGWREAHPVIHTDGSAGEQVLADGVVTKL